MERQEIFNILQNFNLPKNKKDIITDLILNNKDNNSNNNTGNSNVIDYSIDDVNTDIDNLPFGYIRLALSSKYYNSKGEIAFGSKINYIADIDEKTFICIPGLHINGEETMTREQYNKAFAELYEDMNPDDVNKEEANYIIDYIKKHNIFLILDGRDSSQTLISNIYFFNPHLDDINNSAVIFPIAYNIKDNSPYTCKMFLIIFKGVTVIQCIHDSSTYIYTPLIKSNE